MIGRLLESTAMIAPLGAVAARPQEEESGVRVPAHQRLHLENGITLIIVPRRDVPLVAFNAVLRGGELGDVVGKTGIASMVAGLLEKGAGERGAFEFADAVEGAGGSFNAHAGPEAIILRGQFLARDQQLMLELLSDALLRPRFDSEELKTLRERQIELIKAAKDSDPAELIGTYGRALLFPNHPYGRPVIGSEATLAAISRQDVLDYYGEGFGGDRLTLVFAGDVDAERLQRSVSELFSSWPRTKRPLHALAPAERLKGRRVLLIDSPGSVQTYFWIGNVGVDRKYPRRAALELVNTLYGGRFTSILNTELRIKSGLSYGARSTFTRGSTAGEFAIRSFAQTENTGKAVDLALQTLRQLKSEGVDASMLESARAYVLGQFPMDFETAADWAAALGEIELYRLGPGYIDDYTSQLREVGLKDAQAVIEQAFPAADSLAIVLIGDAAKIRNQVASYGPITEMPLTQPSFSAPPGAVRTAAS